MVDYNNENCGKLAEFIVDRLSTDDLMQIVYEDLEHSFAQDRDLFDLNCAQYDWSPE